MSNSKRTVLITGCSDGGLGAALAVEFHRAGLHVYATARDTSKMKHLQALGIETLHLDVQSESSIAACVKQLSSLDILVNNAGSPAFMPIADVSIEAAKRIYDLNVWAPIAMIQAFLPLLLKSPRAMIVNQTSVSASCTMPFGGIYHSSKAAIAMLSDTLRLELAPFDVTVVDLRTGAVKSEGLVKHHKNYNPTVPPGSIYEPAKDVVEKVLTGEVLQGNEQPQGQWAEAVVKDLLKKTPPAVIWRGSQAQLARFGTILPHGSLDGTVKKITNLDEVERLVRK
jgi:1-acylglycerone phosphate reductase